MNSSSVTPAAGIGVVPVALAAELAGLPETDRTRILAVIAANHAPTTLTIYAYAWRQWTTWCAGRDLEPLPASPAAVCAYLTERAEQGAAFATPRWPAPQSLTGDWGLLRS